MKAKIKSRKIITIIIIVIIILFISVAIVIANQLLQRQTTTPEESKAGAEQLLQPCGQPCKSTSDCRSPTPAGVIAECKYDPNKGYNTCQSAACPAGYTIDGANCDCGLAGRKCGETCGAAQGLCAAGGMCTYVTSGSNCSASGSPTYCVPYGPENPDFERLNCVARDQNNQYYRQKSTGKTVFTQADIIAACKWCGNGIQESGEECDDGTKNGTSGSLCSTSCTLLITPTLTPIPTSPNESLSSTLPNTAIIDDNIDKVIMGFMLVTAGVITLFFSVDNFLLNQIKSVSRIINTWNDNKKQEIKNNFEQEVSKLIIKSK